MRAWWKWCLRAAQNWRARALETGDGVRARAHIQRRLETAAFARFVASEVAALRDGVTWIVGVLSAARSAKAGLGARTRVVRLTRKQALSHAERRWNQYDGEDWSVVQELLDHGAHAVQRGRNHFFSLPPTADSEQRVSVIVIHEVGEELHLGTFNLRIRFDWVLQKTSEEG